MGDGLVGCIRFISYEYHHGGGISVGFDFVDPVVFDIEEGVSVGEVEDEKDCVGVWVRGRLLL